jgi:hypothetical protein
MTEAEFETALGLQMAETARLETARRRLIERAGGDLPAGEGTKSPRYSDGTLVHIGPRQMPRRRKPPD